MHFLEIKISTTTKSCFSQNGLSYFLSLLDSVGLCHSKKFFNLYFFYYFTGLYLHFYLLPIFSHLLLVDVGYGPWSPWGECDAPCGLGARFRQRICRKNRNSAKEGVQQTETCAANLCPIDGGIIQYTQWKRLSRILDSSTSNFLNNECHHY